MSFIALSFIPFEAVAVRAHHRQSASLVWRCHHLVGYYHVQIFPFFADAFSIFLFYQFFINIPKDLDEAALIDGASLFEIYWRLSFPFQAHHCYRCHFTITELLETLYVAFDGNRGEQVRP